MAPFPAEWTALAAWMVVRSREAVYPFSWPHTSSLVSLTLPGGRSGRFWFWPQPIEEP